MEELKSRLAEFIAHQDSTKRRLGVAAILTEALKKYSIKPVIVGGFAVELWTMGKYATLDIDIIADGIAEYGFVLRQLGFINNGGVWCFPGTDIIIEFPKPPLDGEYERVQIVNFENLQFYVLGIEDIILDRISAAKHWQDLSSKEWAIYLMAAHFDKIEWSYCEKTAVEKQVSGLLQEIKNEAKNLLS